jgi:hypothetical protein
VRTLSSLSGGSNNHNCNSLALLGQHSAAFSQTSDFFVRLM